MERNNGVDGGGRRRATHASRGTSSPRGVELTHPKGERINWPRWKTLSNIPPKENNVNYSQKKTVRRIPEFPGIRQVEPQDFLSSQEFGNSGIREFAPIPEFPNSLEFGKLNLRIF
jgi:hypothetical protein